MVDKNQWNSEWARLRSLLGAKELETDDLCLTDFLGSAWSSFNSASNNFTTLFCQS